MYSTELEGGGKKAPQQSPTEKTTQIHKKKI